MTEGLVLDCGQDWTRCAAVVDGHAATRSQRSSDIGARAPFDPRFALPCVHRTLARLLCSAVCLPHRPAVARDAYSLPWINAAGAF